MMFKVAAFYAFTPLPDCSQLQAPIDALCAARCARGTVLLAPEGLNGTLAAAPEDMDCLIRDLGELTRVDKLQVRFSPADMMPFLRLKVRLKDEIVTIGDRSIDPRARTGTKVAASDWNALIADPETVLIDVRNGFEVELGSFPGAVDPLTVSFGDFPAYVRRQLDPKRDTKVAMFCTGGIRCEKASSFMLREGFETVYQLDGGILAYLEQVPAADSLWRGSCFVFDQRVAVGSGLRVDDAVTTCFGCRRPLTPADRALPAYEDGVSCPHCVDALTPARKTSTRERHRQVRIATRQGRAHLGKPTSEKP